MLGSAVLAATDEVVAPLATPPPVPVDPLPPVPPLAITSCLSAEKDAGLPKGSET
jgi:hypothetical protein